MISADGLKNSARMMIDTGAGRNFIKLNIIVHNVEINQDEILRLTGINGVPVYTLGQITLNIFEYPTNFNLIPNSAPVEEDGVLESEFFTDNDVNINYIFKCLEIQNNKYPFRNPATIIFPARSISTLGIRISNTDQKEGFIPIFNLKKGIYAGNAIAKNHGGKAYIKVANILSIPIEIETPIIMLEDFEEIKMSSTLIKPTTNQIKTFTKKNHNKSPEELINKFINSSDTEQIISQFYKITEENRIKIIKELLCLDHMKQEEFDHVTKLIIKHSDRFQIPDESLEPTNAAMNSIPTVDERPTFSKQYRFPPAHKKEITKQLNELLKK